MSGGIAMQFWQNLSKNLNVRKILAEIQQSTMVLFLIFGAGLRLSTKSRKKCVMKTWHVFKKLPYLWSHVYYQLLLSKPSRKRSLLRDSFADISDLDSEYQEISCVIFESHYFIVKIYRTTKVSTS